MARIPTGNGIRARLDRVPPPPLFAMFSRTLAALEAGGGWAPFQRPGGHVLIALDGTEYFRSRKRSCPNGSSRARANGKTEPFHQMVLAAMAAPGYDRAVPLEPEFITPRDGVETPDCESRATARWRAAHGPR